MVREVGYGGTERQMTELAKSIDRSRFEPHVGCFIHGGEYAWELQSAGVPVTAFGVHSFVSQCVLRGARAMGQYLREHRIQLVHTFDAPANVFGVITARAFRVPVVISSQRALRGLVPWKMRMLLRATDRLADAVVANCGAVHDQLVSEEKVPAKKIHLCYNGLDTDKFRPAPPWRPPELSGASVVIGCACVMRPEKDLETLLRAFAGMKRDRSVKLLLIGSGPSRAALQRLSGELGLASDCVFVPAVQNVQEWLHAMDIFVLPSTSEAFSNSLMEAMASGCCPIASRVGGNPELVRHGETGLLFEPRDVAGLRAALESVVENRELRQKLGQKASDWIRGTLSLRVSVSHMEQIYEDLLETRSVPVPSGGLARA